MFYHQRIRYINRYITTIYYHQTAIILGNQYIRGCFGRLVSGVDTQLKHILDSIDNYSVETCQAIQIQPMIIVCWCTGELCNNTPSTDNVENKSIDELMVEMSGEQLDDANGPHHPLIDNLE